MRAHAFRSFLPFLSAAAVLGLPVWQPPAALAQTVTAASAPASDSGKLVTVEVTAEHRKENEQDVPVSTSVLSGDGLQVLGDSGEDVKQLAFRVPSLNIESSNGRAFPRFYIRGYGNTDFHDFASQPVGLVYDDIIQENAALKGFPIFDQEDVEVLRGPQGTLFGRNAPAGVVKLESVKPQLGETSSYFSLSDGTFGSMVMQGIVNLPLSDQVAFRASFQDQHRDNWVYDPINVTHEGGFDDMAIRLQWLLKASDTFSAVLNIHGHHLNGSSTLFRANIISPGSNRLIAGFNPGTFYADGPNSSELGTLGLTLHMQWTFPSFTFQSISGYETVQKYLAEGDIDGGYGPGNVFCQPNCTVPTGPGAIPFAVETSAGLLHHEQWTQEFRALSTGTGPLQGQAGVFLFYEDVVSADDDYCAPGSTDTNCGAVLWTLQDQTISRQRNDAEAVFGSLEYALTSALKARAGVRVTEDHKNFAVLYSDTQPPPTAPLAATANASNVSWDASATWSVAESTNLYTRVATGFRAPSFGPPAAGLPVQVARSETDISYEIGIKTVVARSTRLDFDIYDYDVANQQLTAAGGLANTIQLLNARNTYGKGAELELDTYPVAGLSFNLSGSYNYTRIDDPTLSVGTCFSCTVTNPTYTTPAGTFAYINGNALPEAARWVGDASLRYDVPIGQGSVYVYTDLMTRSGMNAFLYTSKEFTLAPLTEAGLRLGYTWGDGKYDTAVFCRNCANQIRVIGAIDFDNLTGYINDPRVFGAQFAARF